MQRLTKYVDGEVRENHDNDRKRYRVSYRECMARLAAYEDTGLEPHEMRLRAAELEMLRSGNDLFTTIKDNAPLISRVPQWLARQTRWRKYPQRVRNNKNTTGFKTGG
jgi:hypothetical protein